jgi:hypothetical protein
MIQFILSDNWTEPEIFFLDKFKQWHFHSPSNKVNGLKKISNYMQGLKSVILAFEAGMAVPCKYGPRASENP